MKGTIVGGVRENAIALFLRKGRLLVDALGLFAFLECQYPTKGSAHLLNRLFVGISSPALFAQISSPLRVMFLLAVESAK